MTTAIATVMIALTVGVIVVMAEMVRHLRCWEAFFAAATWMRVINWTAAVTVAAAAGFCSAARRTWRWRRSSSVS